MQSLRRLSFLFVLCAMAGCRPGITDPFAYLSDPVARATGVRWSWEPRQHFDAGIDIFRYHTSDTALTGGSTDLRAAFDVNDNPVQVQGVTINGELLPWIPQETNLYHAQVYAKPNDTASYGATESATYSFVGYDGEAWTSTVRVAPDFGKIVTPDTVSLSQGLTIHYDNPVPGDSLRVIAIESFTKAQADSLPYSSLTFDKWLPDTAAIVITASQLPHVPGSNQLFLQAYRFHFATQISPKGKVIGIYSEEDFPSWAFPVKP